MKTNLVIFYLTFEGYVVKDKAYIHSCGWVKNWNDVSDSTKKQLENKEYDKECPDKLVAKYNQHLHDLRKMLRANFTDADEARNHTRKKTPKNFITQLFF